MGYTSPTPGQLLREAVIFWSIGLVLYVGRMISRILSGGSIKRLQADDYVMTVAFFFFYTPLMVLIQVSARYATNLMDPKEYESVLADPQQVADRIYGSKVVIALEQCMLALTWGVKACLLIMYYKMTQGLPRNLFVKILAAFVALGYVVIMITYFAVYCRPFSQYWAMPVENMQCATYQNYSITQAVFNISSDFAMLAIPIPLLLKTQIPRKKKLILCGVFSLGIFVIIAAILNKYFNFAAPLTTTYMIWYIRESSTAVYVANMVCWWPLLSRIFGLRSFQAYTSNQRSNTRLASTARRNQFANLPGGRSDHQSTFTNLRRKLPGKSHTGSALSISENDTEVKTNGSNSSKVAINKDNDSQGGDNIPLEIWHKVEYEVEEYQSTNPMDQQESFGQAYVPDSSVATGTQKIGLAGTRV